MERVEPVPAGIIEDAVVVGCAAFREDAGTDPPARRPAEILERLPNRAPVNGGIEGGRGRRCRAARVVLFSGRRRHPAPAAAAARQRALVHAARRADAAVKRMC